jgi:hypothetical protein
VVRSLLAALGEVCVAGLVVGWVVDRLVVCWPVSWEVVVAVDIIPRIGWKDVAGLSIPCWEGYAAALVAAGDLGVEMQTSAKPYMGKHKQASHAWWAKAAYNEQDRDAALAALQATGIPLKSVSGAKDVLSAMARGDALIKGAAKLTVPRRKGHSQPTRYHYLLQWRLVMGYAGFEVFAKACPRKPETVGLGLEDFERLTTSCRLPSLTITPPMLNAETSRWLGREGNGDPIDVLGDFLRLGSSHTDFLHDWFKGRPIEQPKDALHLAKILRHATVHGVLSPAKCRGLGLTDALKVLSQVVDKVRSAVVNRVFES